MRTEIELSFLGSVTVRGPEATVEVRGAQPALLLAFAVLERPRPLLRDELGELLWPDRLPDHWEGAARQVVSRARRALVQAGLPGDLLTSSVGATHFDAGAEIVVDIETAIERVLEAERLVDEQTWLAAIDRVTPAIQVLRRPFLGRSDGPWVAEWRQRAGSFVQRGLLAASAAAHGAGRAGDAIDHARAAVERDLYDERATRALMEAEARAGNRAGALAAYEELRRRLDDELGVRPSEETEERHRLLLGDVPGPARGTAVTPPDESTETSPFVGREAELRTIDEAARPASSGRFVVVEGEAGIGKTRLARVVADRARAEGSLVLWGRCAPTGAAHGPSADLVAQLLHARPDTISRLGPLASHLAPIVPDLVPQSETAAPVSSEQLTTRLFRAIDAAIASVRDQHLMVVLDDLQWADEDTLMFLERVGARLADQPGVLLVALREPPGSVAGTIVDLSRSLDTTSIRLEGLSRDDVAVLLSRSRLVLDDADAAASVVAARTAGNALYVTQLIREAEGSPGPFDPTAVPEVVARLLERRLAALDPELVSVLALAAVAGSELDLGTLEACVTIEPDDLLDRVEDLSRKRFLEERAAGRFAFAHELVRDAVLSTIGATRRQRLHRRIADGLAAARDDPAAIANHYAAAGESCIGDATRWSLVAGEDALARAAWSSAVEHLERAARWADRPDQRCDALVGLGRAHRALGRTTEARATLEDALALARAHGLGRAIAATTLTLVGGGGRGVALEMADSERELLLRAALEALDDEDRDLAVPVLAELALSLVLTQQIEERIECCERALELARESGGARLLATALWARRIALMGPAGTEERLADGREAAALPVAEVPADLAVAVQLGLVEDLLELGERAEADAALERARQLAADLDHPYWLWATESWHALTAIIDDDLDTAEQRAFAALSHQPEGHPEAVAALGVNLVDIRLLQGRAGEMIELLADEADAHPNIPCYRAVLALCCAAAGDRDGARTAFEVFVADDFDVPVDSNWLLTMASLADVAATLGDVEAGAVLADRLAPYADRQVLLNCYGGGGAWWGPVAYHLGRLARLGGDDERARTLLRDATAQCKQFRAPRYAAWSSERECARVTSAAWSGS